MPVTQRYEFTVIDEDGKDYRRERVVTGTHVSRQTIVVHGVGSEEDSHTYGRRGRPTITMESTARMIAHGIIRRGASCSA